MKAPRKVVSEITSIQKNFLWGGNLERKKIAWVKWSEVCKPKITGGLGIKDIHLFNLSLLGKWLWRIVREEEALWIEVLKFRYNIDNIGFLDNYCAQSSNSFSAWWRDICSIESGRQVPSRWFKSALIKKVGDGRSVGFWTDSCWIV